MVDVFSRCAVSEGERLANSSDLDLKRSSASSPYSTRLERTLATELVERLWPLRGGAWPSDPTRLFASRKVPCSIGVFDLGSNEAFGPEAPPYGFHAIPQELAPHREKEPRPSLKQHQLCVVSRCILNL